MPLRECGKGGTERERGPRRPLGIVLVHGRDPEDGEHRVAGELLRHATEAVDAVAGERRRRPPWSERTSSGSSCSPSAVEPARSAKRTVTTRRSRRSSAIPRNAPVSAVPQAEQNAAPGAASTPHAGQVIASDAPQALQKRASSSFAA